ERQRERDLVPRWLRADVQAAGERAGRKEEREAENHEQQLGNEVDDGNREAERVEPRRPEQAHERDRPDQDATDDHIPRALRDRVPAECESQVVREEERRERDHDQVVEEERPAGDEPSQVVEGDADEGRGAAGFPDRGRPLRIRQGHDQEEHADNAEDHGRETERVQSDDAEREEEHAEDVAGRASADRDGLGEEREPEADRDEAEDEDRATMQVAQAARSRGVATMTRQGACRRTKSTASPKIWRRPCCRRTRRGPAITMISECRRIASSTIARPMLRVRAMRPMTFTPYESPVARASASV